MIEVRMGGIPILMDAIQFAAFEEEVTIGRTLRDLLRDLKNLPMHVAVGKERARRDNDQ